MAADLRQDTASGKNAARPQLDKALADRRQDPPPYAGHVVRRVLLRRNIVVDPETA